MLDQAGLDRAVRLYAEIGLSPERTVGQLLRAGYPIAMVRARFPDAAEHLFLIPAEPGAVRTSHAAALKPAQEIARQVLARALAVTHPPPVATSEDAGDLLD